MTTFYLIRHALTDAVGHTIVGRMPGVRLNSEGERQVESLTRFISGRPLSAIYSSPLARAQQTARPIAERLRLQLQTADELNEVDFGQWTDHRFSDLGRVPLWQKFNTFRSGMRIPGGELMLETQLRIVSWMQLQTAQRSGLEIALVSHGDVIRLALAYWLGQPIDLMKRLQISPACVSALKIDDVGPELMFHNFDPTF